jgi:hypothetical protein
VNDKALIIKTTIILMKFNRNNVGIEENFQVSSFTAFRPRLNNLMSTNMCDTTVIIQSVCPFPCHEITRDDPTSSLFEIYKSFLAHLAKGNENCFRYLKLMSPLNAAICTTVSYTL